MSRMKSGVAGIIKLKKQESSVSVTTSIAKNNSMVDVKASINEEDSSGPFSFKITILGARNLMPVDSGKSSDPYVKVNYGNAVLHKTQVVKKNLNPVWSDEKFTVSGKSSALEFQIKDKNTFRASVPIGIVLVDLNKLNIGLHWLPITQGTGELQLLIEK